MACDMWCGWRTSRRCSGWYVQTFSGRIVCSVCAAEEAGEGEVIYQLAVTLVLRAREGKCIEQTAATDHTVGQRLHLNMEGLPDDISTNGFEW